MSIVDANLVTDSKKLEILLYQEASYFDKEEMDMDEYFGKNEEFDKALAEEQGINPDNPDEKKDDANNDGNKSDKSSPESNMQMLEVKKQNEVSEFPREVAAGNGPNNENNENNINNINNINDININTNNNIDKPQEIPEIHQLNISPLEVAAGNEKNEKKDCDNNYNSNNIQYNDNNEELKKEALEREKRISFKRSSVKKLSKVTRIDYNVIENSNPNTPKSRLSLADHEGMEHVVNVPDKEELSIDSLNFSNNLNNSDSNKSNDRVIVLHLQDDNNLSRSQIDNELDISKNKEVMYHKVSPGSESKRSSSEYYSNRNLMRKGVDKGTEKGNELTNPDIDKNNKTDPNQKKVKFTIKDLEELDPISKLKYDSRTYLQYFVDCLGDEHIILNIFMKKSIFLPVNYRVLQGIALTSIMFFLNALLYTDDNIQKTNQMEQNGVITFLNYFKFNKYYILN